MSDPVDRLKGLLFDREVNELRELIDRVGTKERLESSVAEVIDGALHKAEVERHDELAQALAPVVVKTVKTEIRNSKDELVEALYPMTGRMVKAYIASAMKDLANDINRRLESNPMMLRLRSLSTGMSMAELAMADAQRLEIEELYLIRRATGALIARWPDTGASPENTHDHVMSGILTAINEFSSEALKDEGSSLRQIDLGERQLYLRASPVYLLAAKCSGTAAQPIEGILDEAFLATIERLHALPIDAFEKSNPGSPPLLPDLSDNLGKSIIEKHQELAGATRGFSPLKLLAWLIGLPLAAWIGWTVYADYKTERARNIAAQTLQGIAELNGYPVRLEVSPLGETITVGGLVPTAPTKDEVGIKLRQALPYSTVRDQLTVLPNPLGAFEEKIAGVRADMRKLDPEIKRVEEAVRDLKPEIARVRGHVAGLNPEISAIKGTVSDLQSRIDAETRKRALNRTTRKLNQIKAALPRVASLAGTNPQRQSVTAVDHAVEQALTTTATAVEAHADDNDQNVQDALFEHAKALREASRTLAGLITDPGLDPARPTANLTRPSTAAESAEQLASEADLLSETTVAAEHVLAFKKALPPPAEPRPRAKLEAWSHANAIFFGEDIEYREPAKAKAVLTDLARLMGESNLLIRVVGYTDSKGNKESNNPLSQSRAEKVAGELMKLGVPANRIVAIGRVSKLQISQHIGNNSPNRRVEFEVGFNGESAR